MNAQLPTGPELQELAVVIRRTVLARGLQSHAAEDVAQETLSRLLAVADRLTPEAWLPLALTTASNLTVDAYRNDQRARKHQHRLLERHESGPELGYLATEQAAAVRAAMGGLPHTDRQLLIDHTEGSSTHELAEASRSTPAAIAARLARTRARLRLDYLLALRRVELPTVTCRRVLLAISAADQRRQQALNAAEHLGKCATCTDLVPPLAERRSRLAGIALAPLVALGTLGGKLHLLAKNHAVQAVTGAVAAGTAAAVIATQAHTEHPRNAPTAASSRRAIPTTQPAVRATAAPPIPASRGVVQTASGNYLLPLPSSTKLRSLVGQRVVVSDMAVQSVASHPGFWIGAGSQRIYVHIADPANIRTRVRVGQRVSFAAELLANPPGYATADGVDPKEGSTALGQQGVHLDVQAADLVIAVGG